MKNESLNYNFVESQTFRLYQIYSVKFNILEKRSIKYKSLFFVNYSNLYSII